MIDRKLHFTLNAESSLQLAASKTSQAFDTGTGTYIQSNLVSPELNIFKIGLYRAFQCCPGKNMLKHELVIEK